MTSITPREREFINQWQRGFPLAPRPFQEVASTEEESEAGVLSMVRDLIKRNVVSRVGAVVAANTIGASTLAAMAVPDERLEEVAEIVNAEPAVNHNYEREHAFNLWFVVTACDVQEVSATLTRISEKARLPVIDLPLEKAYHIDLGFPI